MKRKKEKLLLETVRREKNHHSVAYWEMRWCMTVGLLQFAREKACFTFETTKKHSKLI